MKSRQIAIAIAAITSVLFSGLILAAPPTPGVNVVNTPDVNVVNTPDVNIVKKPVVLSEFDSDCGNNSCGVTFDSPSSGKTLVIEHIYVRATLPESPDELLLSVSCQGNFDGNFYNARIGVAEFTGPGLNEVQILSKAVTLYFDDTSEDFFCAVGKPDGGPISDVGFTITGYVMDSVAD